MVADCRSTWKRLTRGLLIPDSTGRAGCCTGGDLSPYRRDEVALFGELKLVVRLKVDPKLRRGTEMSGKPQRGINGNALLSVDDLVDTSRWNLQVTGKPVLTDAKRFHEFLKENLSRMNWRM